MVWGQLAVAGATVGLNAILGNQADDGGAQGPEDWEKYYAIIASWLNTEEGKKKLAEYEARTDAQYANAINTAVAGGPETLATFDASNAGALEELLGLRDRQNEGALAFLNKVRSDRTEFLADFERRGADLMGGYRGDLAGFLGRLGTRHEDILGGYEDRYRTAERGYADRYLMAEGELEGYGEQMSEDIDRYFEEQQTRTAMGLHRRGLFSSTVAEGRAGEVTERQTAEQRRLEESLMMNRINVLGGMSGESTYNLAQMSGQTLAAEERTGSEYAGYEYGGINTALTTQAGLDAMYAAYDAAMRGDEQAAMRYMEEVDAIATGNIANFYGTEAINRANIVNRGYGDLTNVIMGWQNMPPQMNDLNAQLGYNIGGSPQAPDPWASFAAQAAPGISQGLYNYLSRDTTTQPSQFSYEAWEPGQYQMDQWNDQMYPPVVPNDPPWM